MWEKEGQKGHREGDKEQTKAR